MGAAVSDALSVVPVEGSLASSPPIPSQVAQARCRSGGQGHPSEPGLALLVVAINVLLSDWEHMCCGERRRVGDVVTIPVQNYEGTIYEHRHGEGTGIAAQPITGTVTAIQWRPAILLREGDYAMKVIGYEPGFPVESTDYDDPVVTNWAFDFTVETSDPIPAPRRE